LRAAEAIGARIPGKSSGRAIPSEQPNSLISLDLRGVAPVSGRVRADTIPCT
jgi:hypothetical protein